LIVVNKYTKTGFECYTFATLLITSRCIGELVHVVTTNLYLSFLSLLTIIPLLISIILGGTWMPAKDQIPNPIIGKKIKKVINTPVMMGVVRIWTRSRSGPPVGMVELDRPEEEDEGRVADDDEVGR